MPLLDDLSRAFPKLRASADAADRTLYARDLWPRHHMAVRAGVVAEHEPGAIAWPESTNDVAKLVLWANETGTKLVPFGAGSGVCGGVLPAADVLVVDLKRMARWRRLDRDAPELDVEAGHMGVPLEEGLNREGLTLGHFPSSILCSTVGGWVAARSAGQCSGYYGKIEDMVASLELVTGDGEVVTLNRRASGPDLVPLVVGSEGTFGVVTSTTLRLHPSPPARAFAAWSFPTTEHGWEAMRAMFQAGLRPAVARLYDPFDAMLARMGGVKAEASEKTKSKTAPGASAAALRSLVRRPGLLNDLLHSNLGGRALGGAMIVAIFEGTEERATADVTRARALAEGMRGKFEGEEPARRWLKHRYSVSYRQAPIFATGAFVDTMEVAASWSRLGALYDGVRRALGEHVFVMAHMSHAYPDGCCIYFSFVGSAAKDRAPGEGWDAACARSYDRAWKAALAAAVEAGGTIAHHHGVGRSKAPRMGSELGAGIDVVRGLMRAFDPRGLMNPGNLVGDVPPEGRQAGAGASSSAIVVDRVSLLVEADARVTLEELERRLAAENLTLDLAAGTSMRETVGAWIEAGTPGTRDRWLDPADQALAGLEARLADGRAFTVHPAPRRAVGPDLTSLVVGARGRFAEVLRAWIRVHRKDAPRPETAPYVRPREPLLSAGEEALLARVARTVGERTKPS